MATCPGRKAGCLNMGSGGNAGLDDSEPVACVRCGAMIDAGIVKCTACGWTYADGQGMPVEDRSGADLADEHGQQDDLSSLGQTSQSFEMIMRSKLVSQE